MRNTVVYETSYATLIGCTISNNHSPLKYLLSNSNNACIPVLAAFDRGATYTLYNRRARAAASQSRQSAQTRRQRAIYVGSQSLVRSQCQPSTQTNYFCSEICCL